MRRRILALAGACGMALAVLAASPAAADSSPAPAPAFEEALGAVSEPGIDLSEAVAAPLANTTSEDGELTVLDDELPMGYCGGAWSWELADLGDYRIDLTYGLSADCNFPPAGFPEPDIGTEAQLHGIDGGPGAIAPSGHGSFGFPAESIETVERSWPSAWSMSAEMSILLVYEDPKQPWVWVEVPPECQGAGTNMLYCQYQTEPLYIGNTPCGTSNSFSDTGGEMWAGLTCYDSSGSISGSVTDTLNDGQCTYALAQTSHDEYFWEGVCDGGGTKSFTWPTESTIVHTWLYFQ